MKKIKTYSGYSDFGQDWLGELPSHWKVMRTKLLFELITEPAPVGNSEELLSVYTALGVKPRKDLEARGNKASSTDNYWRVKKGDIIVNKLLAWMGAIGISEYNGVTSPAYDILRPTENTNPHYYNYLFRNPISSREFKRHSRGIMDMRLRLYFTRFGDIKLPYPPFTEQTAIANFLDYKLEKIARFVKKKKQLVSLLKEQKTAIINQAVTTGINPKTKLKPSGIEFLKDIPFNWKISKLKFNGYLYGGLSGKSGKDFKVENHPNNKNYIPFTNIANNSVIDNNQLDTVIFYEEEKQNEVLQNDILLLMSSETYSDIGKSSLMKDYIDEVYLNSFCKGYRITSNGINSSFLNYLLKANIYRKQLIIEARGFTRINLKIQKVKDLTFYYPENIDEQKEIVNFIENETAKIDKTISTIKKEITLVEEYKTSLIAEAVTGKIDVSDFNIPTKETPLAMVAEEAANYKNSN